MYEIASEIEQWFNQEKPVCLATVIRTWGSSPRPAGAKMAFTPDPFITGSVSGGCVEGAVIEAGIQAMKKGETALLHYGVADETAVSVGLACGGEIDVFVRQFDIALFRAMQNLMQTQTTAILLTVIEPRSTFLGCEILSDEKGLIVYSNFKTIDDPEGLIKSLDLAQVKQSKITALEIPGQNPAKIFIDVISLPPVLVIVGGVHIAVALAALAKALNFHVIVIDPRKAFATRERFPQADQIIQEWPDEAFQKVAMNSNVDVAILTHDPKIDDPALKIVLSSPAQYIGVLGSRMTHKKRRQRLLAEGITEQQLARLHAPIGIDLGKTPQEIALGILAEIVAVRNGRKIKW
ncbi:MAG: XdhC family protein [Anaerolineales bacterium]|nr:XdhC family protein [Anaerolineales bacterium]